MSLPSLRCSYVWAKIIVLLTTMFALVNAQEIASKRMPEGKRCHNEKPLPGLTRRDGNSGPQRTHLGWSMLLTNEFRG
jgi:hypothetical protein